MTAQPLVMSPPVETAVDVVVPVHNEEVALEPSVRRLHHYLTTRFPVPARITVVDNASTDGTWALAQRLEQELPGVRAVRLPEKGRGRALKHAWGASDARVLAYMDVDLSTDLDALLPLVAPLLSGHSDVAIGTRLARSARVHRGVKRELISRCYNLVLHASLTTGFSDAQCGFKAIRADRARLLLPHVEDDAWFFDTELLVLAERSGLRIHEVPVDWVDDPDSRVDIVRTALDDLRGIRRMLCVRELPFPHPVPRATGLVQQVIRFGTVGVLSTLAYVALFVLLHGLGGQTANAVALALTAVGNTAANRRFTFGVRGRDDAARHQLQGLLVFAGALALTSGALGLLHLLTDPNRLVELTVLVLANLLATVLRFVALRGWVFRKAAR